MGDFTDGITNVNKQEVVIGTSDFPIVTKMSNGELLRKLNPERPQQLPTYIFWDETVNQVQKDLVKESMYELYSALNLDLSKIKTYGNWSSNNYLQSDGGLTPNESIEWAVSKSYDYNRRQIQADKYLTQMFYDPYQLKYPHWEIVFTNHDLYAQGLNYCLGNAMPDLGTLISFSRFGNYENTLFGKEILKTEIFHEVGHVLGLPSRRRGVNNLEDSLGLHCKSDGCSMRQGVRVPDDWIDLTEARLKNNRGPYCCECLRDFTKRR